MRVLLINTVCKTGSTGKIVFNIHNFILHKGYESIICFGRGTKGHNDLREFKISTNIEIYLHVLFTRLFGFQGNYSYFATKRLFKIIAKYKPDVVHLFNLHGYYINEFKLLKYLKENNIKTIYSMLDEYPYMGKCCYSFDCRKFENVCNNCPEVKSYPKSLFFDQSNRIFNLKKECYNNFNNIIFTGPEWVVKRAKASSLLRNKKFSIIDEFIDTENVFYPRHTTELRKKLNIPEGKKIMLNVARFSDTRKGCIHYLEIANSLKNENFIFIHVGYDSNNNNKLPDNFIPISYVANQDELAEYYSLADLFVCTSLADTMPNVCLESLACGTPVCGFDIAGTPYVATSEFGFFSKPNNISELVHFIQNVPFKTEKRSEECHLYAKMRYSKDVICTKFLELYTDNN